MARLVLNPDSPTPHEIQLKPGVNRLGRAEDNDFAIADPSVSGSHCQIVVSDDSVRIKDLGSTNGTFVNRAPVGEALLQPGQTIHLGGVAMLFQPDCRAPTVSAGVRPAPPGAVAVPAGAVRVVAVAKPAVVRPATVVATLTGTPPSIPLVAPVPPGAPVAVAAPVTASASPGEFGGPHQCKFHPKSSARYYCQHCQQFFCEVCVNSRPAGGKFCRQCGAECAPVQVQILRPAAPKGFFSRVPGAFVYPFRGMGVLMMILAALVFGFARNFIGLWSILAVIAAFGYLFCFMQNILQATAIEDDEMPSLPGLDDVFGGAFRLAGTAIVSFGIPGTLLALNAFWGMDIPAVYILATSLLGCFYFPMAFLAVAMKDTVLAANPLIVVPAILKAPLAYLVAAVMTIGIYFVRLGGDAILANIKAQAQFTRSMNEMFLTFGLRSAWSLISIYLLTVSMRVLGLLYVANKDKFGWFKR